MSNYEEQVATYNRILALQAQYDTERAQGSPNQVNTYNALVQETTYYQMLQHTANQTYASAG